MTRELGGDCRLLLSGLRGGTACSKQAAGVAPTKRGWGPGTVLCDLLYMHNSSPFTEPKSVYSPLRTSVSTGDALYSIRLAASRVKSTLFARHRMAF